MAHCLVSGSSTWQAEAEREKRAKIIHAEGEFAAAQKLTDAASVTATAPSALQLRYLQTLTEIGVEHNTVIVFPMPIDLVQPLLELRARIQYSPAAPQLERR